MTRQTKTSKSQKKSATQKNAKKTKISYEQKHALQLKNQQERDAKKAKTGEEPANKDRFYCTNKELYAELVKWRDSAEKPEDRVLSEDLGRMMLAITSKMLNRSEFRNYPPELKNDMQGFAVLKLIKGLKNYDFAFNNPFAWMSSAIWNSYISVIMKHYKQINIKKELMKKLLSELETYNGISPSSSLCRCVKQYIGEDAMDDED